MVTTAQEATSFSIIQHACAACAGPQSALCNQLLSQIVTCACADWADDSGKWGELTAPKSSALPVAPPQPKHSSISLADIARDAAGTRAADGRPDPSHSVGAQRGVESGPMGDGQDAASRSYLSLLESLAQEGEFGSPGNSDNDSSPTTTQVHVVEQAWKADNLPSMGPQHPSPRDSYKPAAAEQSSQLSEASSTFGDAAVDGLLPHEASQTHTDNAEGWGCHEASDIHMHVNAHSGGLQESDPGAAGDVQQAGRYLAEEEDQPSSLALALAALAATAAQKHAAQTDMQQLQPDAADSMKPQKADTDLDRQASVSSDSDCDVLAVAAAAAAAAGLSRRQEENPPNDEQAAQLWAVPASAPAPAVEAQAGPHEPLQDAKAGSSHLEFQNDDAQQAQQVGARQRDSASGDYVGPGSSGPSWSAAADGDSGGIGDGIGLFRDKQAVNYVGKSARRPKVGLLCLVLSGRNYRCAVLCYAMSCCAVRSCLLSALVRPATCLPAVRLNKNCISKMVNRDALWKARVCCFLVRIKATTLSTLQSMHSTARAVASMQSK